MSDLTSQLLDTAKIRESFPRLKEVVYLNVGTYGIMPEPALAKFLEVVAEFERGGVAGRHNMGEGVERTRKGIAQLWGSDPEEVAFTRNATDGINLVLAGINWQEGDEVIMTEQEHEAMYHPLLYLQCCKGIKVHQVPVSPKAEVMLETLERIVNKRTLLIAMSHVPCETGTRLPAREICAWARERNILTLFDGAQCLGAFPINVHEMGCDFYTSNGHKWLSGPKGTGVFYIRRDSLDTILPAHVGAGSLEYCNRNTGEAKPQPSALRFEFGTRAWPLQVGLGYSLDWFESIGWENVYRHIAALSTYLKDRILERPFLRLLTPYAFDESCGLTTFAMPGREAHDISMATRKYHIPVRGIPHYNAIRISTAHFNNQADVDTLIKALDEMQQGETKA